MAKKLPTHLKLHTEESSNNTASAACSSVFDVDELLNSFTAATGWRARPKAGTPHGWTNPELRHQAKERPPLKERIELVSSSPIDGTLDYEDNATLSIVGEKEAWGLLEQIDGLIGQLDQAEEIIERQEARLAATVGVTVRHDESEVLASRLSESLSRATVATNSDAAALYLLDENTSELKMHACYGLPTQVLGEPARDLRGSMADLEALMGNAVLIENTALAPEWNCPQDFAAAICLPIGSPTMPHGTLWVWSHAVRDFSTEDLEILKATAEKLLGDIERNVLAGEVLQNREIDRDVQGAGVIQASRLPDKQPLHLDYEIAGWTFQGGAVGGNFHNWTFNRHEISAWRWARQSPRE